MNDEHVAYLLFGGAIGILFGILLVEGVRGILSLFLSSNDEDDNL